MHISVETARGIVKLILIIMGVQLFILGYIFYQSYEGRKDLVDSQRKGCERGKIDRDMNALGWRQAEEARTADGDLAVAKTYRDIASSLESRSDINCEEAFPEASLIP